MSAKEALNTSGTLAKVATLAVEAKLDVEHRESRCEHHIPIKLLPALPC